MLCPLGGGTLAFDVDVFGGPEASGVSLASLGPGDEDSEVVCVFRARRIPYMRGIR